MMDIRIIPIVEKYIDGYHACLDIVAREKRYLAQIEGPGIAASREWVRLALSKDSPYFIALHESTVVGWCDLDRLERPGFTHRCRLGMGVHPDYRHQGIGTNLLVAALNKAHAIGLERVELEVFASNSNAIRLYEKYGFILEGRKKQGRKYNGVYDDLIDMALFLVDYKPTLGHYGMNL